MHGPTDRSGRRSEACRAHDLLEPTENLRVGRAGRKRRCTEVDRIGERPGDVGTAQGEDDYPAALHPVDGRRVRRQLGQAGLAVVLMSGFFDRHPKINAAVFEASSTWLSFLLDECDKAYRLYLAMSANFHR